MQLSEREKVAHLLRRFGLGASEAEVDYYGANGYSDAVDKLLDFEQVDEGFNVPIDRFAIGENKQVPMPAFQAWWVLRLISTRRPLQEKMAVFWHDHFATSANKVNQTMLMYGQNEILRSLGTGNFRELLLKVSQDPAMIFWLDNQFNVKGKANENFAREVMELFTLGIGHYTEKDIQEAARAFTGWNFRRQLPREVAGDERPKAVFAFRAAQHDDGEKTIFGKTGAFTGEDVIDMLCENPQTSKNIVRKIWEWFAYPNPDEGLVSDLAEKFRNSGLEIKALLRAVMKAPEFTGAKAVRAVYKNPVDFIIPTVRQLGIGEALMRQYKDPTIPGAQAGRGAMQAVTQAMKGMGMELLFPPDVAGWDSGPAWVTSATMVERIQWGDRLFGQTSPEARRQVLRYPFFNLFRANPSPAGVVDTLLSVFDAPLPAARRAPLVAAAEKVCGNAVTERNANATAAAVSRLIFGSPEFQFA
ncbi:MAG: DUF1800 domain-containing protein [Fimbriimonadales bacterium]